MSHAGRRILLGPFAAVVAWVAIGAVAQDVAPRPPAQPSPGPNPAPREFSRAGSILERAVVDAIDAGAGMYNAGDVEGCRRFYEGALFGLRPSLDAIPETRKKVDVFFRESLLARTSAEKAFALRRALDEILIAARSAPAAAKPPAMAAAPVPAEPAQPTKTLWDRLGGIESVAPIVKQWLAACLADPKIDFTRGGKYPIDDVARANLETLLVQYLSKLTAGPENYSGRPMLDSHRGMAITDTQFNQMMTHLVETLRAQIVAPSESTELVALVNATRREIVEVRTTESAPPPTGLAAPAMIAPPSTKSLWDRLGGEEGVTGIVRDLLARAAKNPAVDRTRGGKYALDAPALGRLERKYVEFLSALTGGPLPYAGKTMKQAHQGMKITENQFDSLNGELISVMEARKLPRELIDELITIIGATAGDIIEAK
ncbi:MAG: group 1 truncated hemoglobin [Isosphaeraceae bacterium]|nr:group 1 truncated hemoglobin [Isosphaeraceae bacterium]